jgi:hypothetical protein
LKPCLTENDKTNLNNIVKDSWLNNYFSGIAGSFYNCDDESKTMLVEIYCHQALFCLKLSEITPTYRHIFDTTFSFVKSKINEMGYKLLAYSFEFVYRMFPAEESDIMPLPKEGSILNYQYQLDLETERENKSRRQKHRGRRR